MFRILIALLFSIPTFAAFSSENPVCDASSKTYFGINSFGDLGCFQYGEEDILILRAGNKNSEINRWRSPFNNKYRIWLNDNDSLIALNTRADFDSALVNFGNRAPNKDWCEIVEDPWDAWDYPEVTDECGTHTAIRTRTCTTGGKAEKPCADTCPYPSQEETFAVVNPPCEDCNTDIYLAPDGSPWEVFAAQCPVGESFMSTNCEGREKPVPCRGSTCTNPGTWEYSYCENPPDSDGGTNKFFVNSCGDYRQEGYGCNGSMDIGRFCCTARDR